MSSQLSFFTLLIVSFCACRAVKHETSVSQHSNAYQNASLACTYKLSFKLDTATEYNQTDYMRLIITGQKSVFQSKKQILIDSIVGAFENMPHTQENLNTGADMISRAPQPVFDYEIYKDLSVPKITYVGKITFKKYYYDETENLFSWKINSANESINGYVCQRATTSFRGRQFTAWFTRQIPVSDGPYKFCGLPGLIVKIGDIKNQYVFDLVSLKQTTVPISINFPSKVTNTTREEFLKATADFNANMVERAITMGVHLQNPDAAKQNLREKLRHRNNPLELN